MVDSPLSGWGTPSDEEHLLPLVYASPRLETSARVKSGPGTFYSMTMTNTNAAGRYLQAFDARDVPADGAVPLFSRLVPTVDSLTITWTTGFTFLVGLCVCISTTSGAKTLGAAEAIFAVTFV